MCWSPKDRPLYPLTSTFLKSTFIQMILHRSLTIKSLVSIFSHNYSIVRKPREPYIFLLQMDFPLTLQRFSQHIASFIHDCSTRIVTARFYSQDKFGAMQFATVSRAASRPPCRAAPGCSQKAPGNALHG